MLKPKKRKSGVVILAPRICVAVGKKLVVQDGKWVSDGFSQYTSLTMCAEMRKMHSKKGRDRRSQMPKVIRTVAGWYMRYMKKNFPHAAQPFEEGSFVRTEPTAAGGEFPVRTGTACSSLTALCRQLHNMQKEPKVSLLHSKVDMKFYSPAMEDIDLRGAYPKSGQ